MGCSNNSSQHNLPEIYEISFTCDRGDPVQVRFFKNKEVAILIRDRKATELQQEPSGSGFNYSNGPTSILGKGNDLMVQFGRMAPMNCIAQ